MLYSGHQIEKGFIMDWTIKSASERIGGLSNPGKMPSFGTSIPARHCNVGSRLASVEGTTCSGCYALKGFYRMPNVEKSLQNRYDLLMACESDRNARAEWVSAFAFLLNTRLENSRKGGKNDHSYFRWHDAGDLQGVFHLKMIAGVAARSPGVTHWLPTREVSIVREYLRTMGGFPPNLRVRISAAKLDTLPPRVEGCTGSAVHTTPEAMQGAVSCVAYSQDGECRDCRMCWESDAIISYPKH